MLVRATRIASALTLQVLFFAALFVLVVVAHVAVTTALREMGLGAGVSLAASGTVVLAVVLGGAQLAEFIRERRAFAREMKRLRQGLPAGPCCVVWSDEEPNMPWRPLRRISARFPSLALRLGVEGVAVVGLEIGPDGAPRGLHCVESWPSPVFYDAAAEALLGARFRLRQGASPQPGATYAIPFVFRIAGAAKARGLKAHAAKAGAVQSGGAALERPRLRKIA